MAGRLAVRRHRTAPVVLSALSALSVLAVGCSAGGTLAPEPTTEPTTDPTSSSALPGQLAPDPSATSEGILDLDDPAAYLPTPDDVELTAPGSELSLRERAVVAWEPRAELVGVVDVAVSRLEETTVAEALAGYVFEGDLPPDSVPHFVNVKVDNVGSTDLGGRQLPFYAVDSAGTLVAPTGIERDFALCPGGVLPALFGPGERAESCLIFFTAPGTTLDGVVFRPADGVEPLSWTGRVAPLADRLRDDARAGGNGDRPGRRDREQGETEVAP